MGRLFKDGKSLWQRVVDVALTDVGVLLRGGPDGSTLERLEEVLLTSDFGVAATTRLLDEVERRARRGELRRPEDFRRALRDGIAAALRPVHAPGLQRAATPPTVVLVAGVNGTGKTTTIAKLAHRLQREGERVLLVGADTFRAAAGEQLRWWAQRLGCDVVGGDPGRDPAAVAFDALDTALRDGHTAVLIDTAGRLHTHNDLLQELAKIRRVVARRLPGAPHEVLLVLDATTGQNALQQVRLFRAAVEPTGLVLAKLDSTAKGGVVVALAQEFGLPVKFVGTGQEPEDLEPFDPQRFAEEVLAG